MEVVEFVGSVGEVGQLNVVLFDDETSFRVQVSRMSRSIVTSLVEEEKRDVSGEWVNGFEYEITCGVGKNEGV